MKVVLAVIDDLFQFARASLFGVFSVSEETRIGKYEATNDPHNTSNPQTHFLLKEYAGALESSNTFVQGDQYFVGIENVYLYTDPVISFDTACMTLPYGSKIRLLKFGGRWAQVRFAATEGWVLKDVLKDNATDVFPQFITGVYYDASNTETVKLRLCISDEFGCAASDVPLTSAEYVVYALQKHKRYISWSNERPRIAGTWQRKLRGRSGIHIGVSPKTETIMEYIIDDIGYVAYVEAVFPDGSIKLSSIGLYAEGQYDEEVMTKEQWRELRPVFIEVS